MKKVMVLMLLAVMASVLSADNVQDEILGRWAAEPFLIEQPEGLIITPEAEYSHPYLGMSGINFIDGSFVIITVMDVEYRAFYEIESFDFDNYNINCSFKGGEEFLLKLVRLSGGGWKYLYRIAEDSVFNGITAEDDIPISKPAESETDVETDVETDLWMDAEEQESEAVYSLYTGIMKR